MNPQAEQVTESVDRINSHLVNKVDYRELVRGPDFPVQLIIDLGTILCHLHKFWKLYRVWDHSVVKPTEVISTTLIRTQLRTKIQR